MIGDCQHASSLARSYPPEPIDADTDPAPES
jgi:hypothetical protein